MEEAWELAAVSEARAQKPDWSSRHVRLKYQMVLSSVFLYLVASFKISELNIFGIVKFDAVIEPSKIFWASFMFCLFALIAFVSRSIYESVAPRPEDGDVLAGVKAALNELKVADRALSRVYADDKSAAITGLAEDALRQVARLSPIPRSFREQALKNGYRKRLETMKGRVDRSKLYLLETPNKDSFITAKSLARRVTQYDGVSEGARKVEAYIQRLPKIDGTEDASPAQESYVLRSNVFESLAIVRQDFKNLYREAKADLRKLSFSKYTDLFELYFLSAILPVLAFLIFVICGFLEKSGYSFWI